MRNAALLVVGDRLFDTSNNKSWQMRQQRRQRQVSIVHCLVVVVGGSLCYGVLTTSLLQNVVVLS